MANAQSLINTALSEIISSTIAVKDFVVAEVPLVIEELITWKIMENVADILIISLMIGLTIWGIRWYLKKKEAEEGFKTSDGEFFSFLGLCIAAVISLLALLFELLPSIYDLMQIIFAPKVWLLEYAKDLVQPPTK